MAVQAVFDLGVVAVLVIAWRATSSATARTGLVAAASLLVTPYGWSYDMPAFSLVMGLALARAGNQTLAVKLGLCAGVLAPVLAYVGELFGLALGPVLMSAGFLALAATSLRPSPQRSQ
jgi:hypothetical protein